MNKNKINNFLSEFITGSKLYGTNNEFSDTDIRGVFVAKKQFYFGLNKVEQLTLEDIPEKDNEFFEIKKFFALAKKNNPTILEWFFIPPNLYRYITNDWIDIINNKNSFITSECRRSFQGYAYDQLKRIKTHRAWMLNPPKKKPERKDFNLPDHHKLINATQIGAFNYLVIKYLEDKCLHHELRDQLETMIEYHDFQSMIQSDFYVKETETRFALNHVLENMLNKDLIQVVEQEKKYLQALNYWNQYENWKKNRNPDRAILEEKYGYDCYSKNETEFLTEKGWKFYDEIKNDEKLATLNQTSKLIEFQNFTDRVDKKFTGFLYDYKTQETSCLVTPNHRMFVSSCSRLKKNNYSIKNIVNSWNFFKIEDIFNGIKFPTCTVKKTYFNVFNTANKKEEDYIINNSFGLSDDNFLRLIGMYLADGTLIKRKKKTKTDYTLKISHIKNNRKDTYLTKYFNNFLKTYEYERNGTGYSKKKFIEKIWVSYDKKLGEWLLNNCNFGSQNKKLPFFYNFLSYRQVRILLESLLCGDGYDRGRNRSFIYYTSSKELANNIQEMCINSGGITTQIWGPYTIKDTNTEIYQVYIKKEENEKQFGIIHKSKIKKIKVNDYNVCCFTVPNEILITRRNGKVAIQGNTKHAMQLMRLIYEAEELLLTSYLSFPRPEKDELIAIRNGKYSYDEILEKIEEANIKFDELEKTTPLPKDSNHEKIQNLLISIIESNLK